MTHRTLRPNHSPAVRLVPSRLAEVASLLAYVPVAAQLYDASGLLAWMNEANRQLLGLPSTTYAVGVYNVLSDPRGLSTGSTAYYQRAYAGELVRLPEAVVGRVEAGHYGSSVRPPRALSQILLPLPDETGAVRALLAFSIDRGAPASARVDLASLYEHIRQQGFARTAELKAALAQLELEAAARLRAEADLADREALSRALFANAAVGMALVDPAGGVMQANEALAHLLGTTTERLACATLDSLVHPDDVALVVDLRAELLAGLRHTYTLERRFLTRRGTVVWGRLSETLLRDGAGSPRMTVLVCEDITARVRADEERASLARCLQDTQRLESMGLLAGGVAHDFSNILTTIQGNADLALLSLPSGSATQPYLEQISRAVARAAELTRQMFVYAGGSRLGAGSCDVNEAIGAMAELLKTSLTRDCLVSLRLSSGLPPVAVEATLVRQIVMNLVLNAAEALGVAGGEAVVSTATDMLSRAALDGLVLGAEADPGAFVRVTVSDTGAGMDAETMARIFDPFFTTKLLGRGLGLASVYTIVREQRGALGVQSAPGQGTTFHVWLPSAG